MKQVTQTSLDAYKSIQADSLKLTHSYKEIIETLQKNPNLTDYEIATKLGYSDPNKIRPRRHELMKAGYLLSFSKRKCEISKVVAKTWQLVCIFPMEHMEKN